MIIFHEPGWRGGAAAHDAAGVCGQELSRPCGHLLSQGRHSLNLIIRLEWFSQLDGIHQQKDAK